MDDAPVISVSGYSSAKERDITCIFEHEGRKLEVHMPGAVHATGSGDEHAQARAVLQAAVGALAKALANP
jgi:hypothetical protein